MLEIPVAMKVIPIVMAGMFYLTNLLPSAMLTPNKPSPVDSPNKYENHSKINNSNDKTSNNNEIVTEKGNGNTETTDKSHSEMITTSKRTREGMRTRLVIDKDGSHQIIELPWRITDTYEENVTNKKEDNGKVNSDNTTNKTFDSTLTSKYQQESTKDSNGKTEYSDNVIQKFREKLSRIFAVIREK